MGANWERQQAATRWVAIVSKQWMDVGENTAVGVWVGGGVCILPHLGCIRASAGVGAGRDRRVAGSTPNAHAIYLSSQTPTRPRHAFAIATCDPAPLPAPPESSPNQSLT